MLRLPETRSSKITDTAFNRYVSRSPASHRFAQCYGPLHRRGRFLPKTIFGVCGPVLDPSPIREINGHLADDWQG